MKQDVAGKKKKWLLPVIIAAAVLVIAGVVLAIVFGIGNQASTDADATGSKLYWNIDGKGYLNSDGILSLRPKGEDGLYAIRFAVDGEQVEYKCADKRLVNAIDMLELMGLVFDADGLITSIILPTDIVTETAPDFYVMSQEGNTLRINSSMAMNGMTMDLELTDNTGIYNVDARTETIGMKDTCQIMDKVSVYSNAAGKVTHVFIKERAVEAEVYLRVERFYDSTTAQTTRVPDENGVYTILFSHEGQQVELKCKDKELVNLIDRYDTPRNQMGLLFDDEGYICERIEAALALRGKLLVSNYNVTAIDGDLVTLESKWSTNKDLGTTVTVNVTEQCDDIYITETGCGAEFVGQRVDSLKVGDRVYIYSDIEDNAILIYIIRRHADSPLYYNVSRRWNGTGTKRTPVNGWYISEIVGGGQHLFVRTQSKEIADKMDRDYCLGLKLNGDIIEEVYDPQCVAGRSSAGIGYYVTELMGPIARVVSPSDFENGTNYMLSANCEVYDVSGGYSTKTGAKTELRIGDRIAAYRNEANEIVCAFVTARYVPGTRLYYNVTRSYNSETQETKRVADADGYYVYDMVCDGKEVQLKTKDKKLASYIDKEGSRMLALKVSGGIIRDAFTGISAIEFGTAALNSVYIEKINEDGTVDYYSSLTNKEVKTTKQVIADNCVVYNVSNGYVEKRGERTSLKSGDYVIGFSQVNTGEIIKIFVRTRKINSQLYWHVNRQYNSTTLETTRTPDADGYYVYDLAVNGTIKQFKTKDKDVATRIDSMSGAFGLMLNGNVVKQAVPADAVKGIASSVSGGYDVMKISGRTVTLVRQQTNSSKRGDTSQITLASNCKIYNVSPSAKDFGAKATLGLGDRVTSYKNDSGEIVYIYITSKNTHQAGPISYCPHCDQDVWWEPFTSVYRVDAHYYLTHDQERANTAIGYSEASLALGNKQYDVVLDLNGMTLTTTGGRSFLVRTNLSIVDTAGGGKLQGPGTRDGGLKMQEGVKLDISNLPTDTTIVVEADGVFTTERDDIEKYLNVFVPAGSKDTIAVAGKALRYAKGTYTEEEILANMEIWLAENKQAFETGTNLPNTCPCCSNSVSWVALSGELTSQTTSSTDNGKTHFYLSGDVNYTGAEGRFLRAGINTCLYLNGKTVNYNGDSNVFHAAANTLNIFGDGKVINNGSSVMFAYNGTGVTNIYGGTYTNNTAAGMFEDKAVLAPAATHAMLYGGTFNVNPYTYDIAHGFGNKNVTVADGYGAKNNGNGTWTVEKGAENDTDLGIEQPEDLPETCPCGATDILWIAISEDYTNKDTATSGHIHYYLDGDITSSGTANALQLQNDACLYLNGHTLTTNARFRARSGYSLHIFGEGSIVRADSEATSAMFDSQSTGNIYIHGGTYINNDADVAMFNGTMFVIDGGTFSEDPSAFVASGYHAEDNGDGTYTIKEGDPEPGPGTEPEQPTLPETCPCGATDITWVAISADYTNMDTASAGHTHYYLDADVTSSGTANAMQLQNNACLYLNGHVLTTNARFRARSGYSLHIFGDGAINRINSDCAYAMFESKSTGNIYIHSGVYLNDDTDVAMFDGEKFVISGGTFNADPSALVADGYEAQDNGDGTFTVVEATGDPSDPSDPEDPETPVLCPGCGAENVTWTEISGEVTAQITAAAGADHYRLSDDVTYTGTGRFLRAGVSCCLDLNGKTITYGGNSDIFHAAGNTMNIVGDGKVINNGTTNSIFNYNGAGVINVYGGLYTHNSTTGVFADKTVLAPATTHVVAYGGTFPVDPATYDADNNYANSNAKVADGREVRTNPNGTYTVLAPGVFDAPTTCPACNAENVTWIALSGDMTSQITTSAENSHYYLSDHVTRTGSGRFLRAEADCCLYLNGKTLTYSANSQMIQSVADTLNIFGNGNVVNNGSSNMLTYNGAGRINIYGGNYTNNATAGMFTDKTVLTPATVHVTVYGGTFNVNPATYDQTNGYANANVTIAEGMAVKDNGDGTYTVMDESEVEAPETPEEPEQNLCPLCNQPVESWVYPTSDADVYRTGGEHIWVSQDIQRTSANTFITVPAGKTTCLYLEGVVSSVGKSVQVAVLGGTLNIGGTENGGLSISTKTVGLIYLQSGTLNLSGGTISGGISNGTAASVAATTANVRYQNTTGNGGNIYIESGTFNMYGGTVNGGSAVNGGNIYVAGGTANITGGTVVNGTASGSGANIYAKKDATLTITNVTISDTYIEE